MMANYIERWRRNVYWCLYAFDWC